VLDAEQGDRDRVVVEAPAPVELAEREVAEAVRRVGGDRLRELLDRGPLVLATTTPGVVP